MNVVKELLRCDSRTFGRLDSRFLGWDKDSADAPSIDLDRRPELRKRGWRGP